MPTTMPSAGVGSHDKLEKLRVEQARTLLASTRTTAKELAAIVGFGTPARMKRAFERELGLGPREYRLLFGSAAKNATPA
jgi:transcriptional regulator GlxA family with amidase domain